MKKPVRKAVRKRRGYAGGGLVSSDDGSFPDIGQANPGNAQSQPERYLDKLQRVRPAYMDTDKTMPSANPRGTRDTMEWDPGSEGFSSKSGPRGSFSRGGKVKKVAKIARKGR